MSSYHYLMIRVFQCEDSLTGILTGVYDGWASRLGHSHVRLAILDQGNMELFCEYEEVMADTDKAGKVLRTIRERMGEDAAVMIARAAACPDEDKADLIYRMIVLGLHLKDGTTHPRRAVEGWHQGKDQIYRDARGDGHRQCPVAQKP